VPVSEGREWLTQVLDMPGAAIPTPERAKALLASGLLDLAQTNLAPARRLLQESLAIAREVDDQLGVAHAAAGLGMLDRMQGDYVGAHSYLEEAAAILRLQDQSKGDLASVIGLWGMVAYARGDTTAATARLEEALALGRDAGDGLAITTALSGLIRQALDRNEHAVARAWLTESLTLRRTLGNHWSIAWDLETAAVLSAIEGRPAQAMQLAGAATALRVVTGVPLPPAELAQLQQQLAPAEQALGDAGSATAWAEGQRMPLEQATAIALEVPATG
jgi:tetratricopeptide (TPR) repeat protein